MSESVTSEKSWTLTVAVVIPVYNGGHAFEQCIASVLAANPAPDEIIVVDDGSTDHSCDVARRQGVRLIHTGRQQGPAVARNLGVQAAKSDWIFFIDADVTITPDTVEILKSKIVHDQSIDALIGSYDNSPGAPNLLSQYKNLLHHYTHQQSSSEGFTFWGACGAIRRNVFLELGGFDESYLRPSIEDIELGYRLNAANYKIAVHRDLQVKHLKRWDSSSLLRTDVFQRAIPWSKLLLKYGQMKNSLNLSHWCRARVAVSGLIVLFATLGVVWPVMLWVAAGLMVTLLILDFPILNWFRRERGLLFAVKIIPWHWFSHFYSGIAFAVVLADQQLSKLKGIFLSEGPVPSVVAANSSLNPEGIERVS